MQEIVKNRKFEHVKAFGTRHCFNDIADVKVNPEAAQFKRLDQRLTAHICLEKLTHIWFDNNPEKPTVTFGAGFNYTKLMRAVEKEGFAL